MNSVGNAESGTLDWVRPEIDQTLGRAREALSELELPHRLHNVPRRSPDRDAYVSVSGKMQVPYLLDPNTGEQMFESADIRRYLYETYAL